MAWEEMKSTISLILVLGGIVLVVFLLIPPIRDLVLKALGALISGGSLKGSTFLIFFLKKIVWAHVTWMKHLLTPRSVIFKNLNGEETEKKS